ncbi:hypothetical protein [Mucilaginibacter sp.]|uniref:hypothetical protein n=1 Tax=Mucilaginibacter sp. TaxID=1882438 RepID=UPI0032639171
MKNLLKTTQLPGLSLSALFFLLSCGGNTPKQTSGNNPGTGTATANSTTEYFSVKIDGKLWEAFPDKEYKTYNVSYHELGKQLLIFTEANDGSRIDLSFHSATGLKPGNYPSTRNDNGIQSGVFYYPTAKSSDREMASTTADDPVQGNTVQIIKIDKTDKKAYIIEGTFSPVLHALYETNPQQKSQLTAGKFRVVYHPDSMHPGF